MKSYTSLRAIHNGKAQYIAYAKYIIQNAEYHLKYFDTKIYAYVKMIRRQQTHEL